MTEYLKSTGLFHYQKTRRCYIFADIQRGPLTERERRSDQRVNTNEHKDNGIGDGGDNQDSAGDGGLLMD